MLTNNWSPPRLCLLALEAKEPAQETMGESLKPALGKERICV